MYIYVYVCVLAWVFICMTHVNVIIFFNVEVIAIDDICEKPLDVCIKGEAIRKFPETKKELENVCK